MGFTGFKRPKHVERVNLDHLPWEVGFGTVCGSQAWLSLPTPSLSLTFPPERL